jgi:hypothetical protein
MDIRLAPSAGETVYGEPNSIARGRAQASAVGNVFSTAAIGDLDLFFWRRRNAYMRRLS